jgi:hypothetical protein
MGIEWWIPNTRTRDKETAECRNNRRQRGERTLCDAVRDG